MGRPWRGAGDRWVALGAGRGAGGRSGGTVRVRGPWPCGEGDGGALGEGGSRSGWVGRAASPAYGPGGGACVRAGVRGAPRAAAGGTADGVVRRGPRRRTPPGFRPGGTRRRGGTRARSRPAELPVHEAHFIRPTRHTVTDRTRYPNSLTECDRRASRSTGVVELRKVSGMMIRKSCGRRGGWRGVSPGSLVQFGPWDLCAIRSGRFPPPSTGDGGCFCCPRSPCWPC